MFFLLIIFLWIILFCCSYACMSWRKTELNLHYRDIDWDPTLVISIFLPILGIVWGLMDVILHKLGLIK